MKLLLLAIAPAVVAAQQKCSDVLNAQGCPPTGFCAGAAQVAELPAEFCALIEAPSPCYEYETLFIEDCNGNGGNPCNYVGDGYCDDGTFFPTDFNCDTFAVDGGDCDLIIDCDGNLALASLLANGICHNGGATIANFDCLDYDYDGGDCAPTNCDGSCIDAVAADDGTCQEDFNCKKFEYSFGLCAPPHICPTDWYDMGKEHHRCSTTTGGTRYASKLMDPFNPCECYEYCQEEAAAEGVGLTAFDQYSGKCRCWTGDCSDRTLIECKTTGETRPEGRCPGGTYFPHAQELDCHTGDNQQDVTPYSGYFQEHHHDDGYCDNAQFGVSDYSDTDFGDAPIGNYDCDAHGDGDDCDEATCDEIFATTQFAVLDDANMVCDGHTEEIIKETEWTTACDCYEFCAPEGPTGEELLFQRNNHGMCQCLSACHSQSNCGIESDCQIFSVEPVFDCCGEDWTLGRTASEIADGTLGDFNTKRVQSIQESQQQNKVISLEYLSLVSRREGYCVPEFMCEEYDFSFGETDSNGDMVASPCFACYVNTQEQLDDYTVPDTRCDMASNNGIRYLQLTNFYSLASGRSPFDIDDYCECEVACRLAKYEFYATGPCPAKAGMLGYLEWRDDPSTKFAVDAYKGDCRCWDYCTTDTVWTCTEGIVDRCTEPVAVLLWSDPGATIVLPPVRPNQ
jgi:hypothetical protein